MATVSCRIMSDEVFGNYAKNNHDAYRGDNLLLIIEGRHCQSLRVVDGVAAVNLETVLPSELSEDGEKMLASYIKDAAPQEEYFGVKGHVQQKPVEGILKVDRECNSVRVDLDDPFLWFYVEIHNLPLRAGTHKVKACF